MPATKRPRPGAGPRPTPPAPDTTEPTTDDTTDVPVPDIGSADRVDAILRDPTCPANVRAFVQDAHAVATYLDSVEFKTDDNGYVTVTHPAPAPADDA